MTLVWRNIAVVTGVSLGIGSTPASGLPVAPRLDRALAWPGQTAGSAAIDRRHAARSTFGPVDVSLTALRRQTKANTIAGTTSISARGIVSSISQTLSYGARLQVATSWLIERRRQIEGIVLAQPHSRATRETVLSLNLPAGPRFAATVSDTHIRGRRQVGERLAEIANGATPATSGMTFELTNPLPVHAAKALQLTFQASILQRERNDAYLTPVGETVADRRLSIAVGVPF